VLHWLKGKDKRKSASTPGQREADRALGKAEERLERTEDDTREILEVARKLRRLGEQNDFAQKIKEALGGT